MTRLTPEEARQRDVTVLRLISYGYSNAEIGEEIGVDKELVKGIVRRLLRRHEARNRNHLMTQVFRAGILDPSTPVHHGGNQ